jgi:hypothetical protein
MPFHEKNLAALQSSECSAKAAMAVNSTLEYISFTSLSTYYAILLSIIALITYLLYRHLSPPTHPPSNIPVIQPRIPLIGHILGITLHKTEYLNHLA